MSILFACVHINTDKEIHFFSTGKTLIEAVNNLPNNYKNYAIAFEKYSEIHNNGAVIVRVTEELVKIKGESRIGHGTRLYRKFLEINATLLGSAY